VISFPPLRHGRRPRLDRGTPAATSHLSVAGAILVLLAGCAGPAPSPPAATASSASERASAPSVTGASEPSSPQPATGSAAAGLAVASTSAAGETSLGLVASDGALATIDPPAGGVRQLRSFVGGLLAVSDDGRLQLGTVQGAAIGWRAVPGVAGLAAASASPDGTRIALLSASRLGRGVPLVIRIIDSAGHRRSDVTAPTLEANGGPTWLADGRIALRALARGERDVLAVIRPAASATDTVPLEGVDVVSSGDGMTTAMLGVDSIRVRPAAQIATSGRGSTVEMPSASGTERGQLVNAALDRAGSRIGYVWADQDGVARTIRVCAASGGWREVTRLDLPSGASRVQLAWTN
jgi:hypothetical protein